MTTNAAKGPLVPLRRGGGVRRGKIRAGAAPGLLALLALFLALPPSGARAQEIARIEGAIAAFIDTYLTNPATAEEARRLGQIRTEALDAVAAGGPLSRGPIREVLQLPDTPGAARYALATLLLLIEGSPAAGFTLETTKAADPATAPAEAFYYAHTLATIDGEKALQMLLRLAALPDETRFPVPAEEIAFPQVQGLAFVLAASGTEGLNAFAGLLERPDPLALADWQRLIRAATTLKLIRLAPLFREQAKALPPDSPRLRALLWSLGQLGDLEAVGLPAAHARTNPDPAIREEAVFALGAIRHRRCEGPLVASLDDPAPNVREYALAALSLLPGEQARAAVRERLGGPERSPRVREAYLRAAAAIGDRSFEPALMEAARNWRGLAEQARAVIERLADVSAAEATRPDELWPGLPVNRLSAAELDERLDQVIAADGLGMERLKKTLVLYGNPLHLRKLEVLRLIAARQLTRDRVSAWFETLETIAFLRIRLREDPWPTFAK